LAFVSRQPSVDMMSSESSSQFGRGSMRLFRTLTGAHRVIGHSSFEEYMAPSSELEQPMTARSALDAMEHVSTDSFLCGVVLDSTIHDSVVLDEGAYTLRKGDRVRVSDDDENIVREGQVATEQPISITLPKFRYCYNWDNIERVEICCLPPSLPRCRALQRVNTVCGQLNSSKLQVGSRVICRDTEDGIWRWGSIVRIGRQRSEFRVLIDGFKQARDCQEVRCPNATALTRLSHQRHPRRSRTTPL